MTRIYQAGSFTLGSCMILDENASHHLSRVLRAKISDPIIIFNGTGHEYAGKIIKIGKKSVEVKLDTLTEIKNESPLNLHLVQGIARNDKMDFIIQKAVELGACSITPIITERCNHRVSAERENKRLQHWQAVAVSACEQSGRARLPTIHSSTNYSSWLSSATSRQGIILTPYGAASSLAAKTFNQDQEIFLLIGPEGGFTDLEVSLARANHLQPYKLGPRILRTETAGLAAISILQYCLGDFSESV